MKRKLRALPSILFCVITAAFLITSPDIASGKIRDALFLCGKSLIPSLFPFFVLSDFLVSTGASKSFSSLFEPVFRRAFGVSGKGAMPFILGLLGGYPTGAKSVCTLYSDGEISKTEAERLLLFCGNTGPAFIMGAAGFGIFGSVKAGLILYLTHAMSAVLIAIFCRIVFGTVSVKTSSGKNEETVCYSRCFTSAVTNALYGCLNVTAFIMLFSVIAGILEHYGITSSLCAAAEIFGCDPVRTSALVTGFTELASGISALASHAACVNFALPAAAFILGWGGISVHCQAMSFIAPAGLKIGGYFLAKLSQGIIAAILTALFLHFSGSVEVFSFTGHSTVKAFLFDYLGLFFSLSCALASAVLHIIIRFRRA